MGLDKGKLTLPFKIIDIAKCIGVGSRNLGILCSHRNINLWAKFKPVRSSIKGYLSQDEKNESGYFRFYGYGVGATKYDISLESDRKAMLDNTSSWFHLAPRGRNIINDYGALTDEWFRKWDFNGYNHKCKCPMWAEAAPKDYTLTITADLETNLPENNITIDDLTRIIGFRDNEEELSKVGYGILYRKKGDDSLSGITHISAVTPDGKIAYPVTEALLEETGIRVAQKTEYEVCIYIQSENHGNDAYVHPSGVFTHTVKLWPDVFIIKEVRVVVSSTSASQSKYFIECDIEVRRKMWINDTLQAKSNIVITGTGGEGNPLYFNEGERIDFNPGTYTLRYPTGELAEGIDDPAYANLVKVTVEINGNDGSYENGLTQTMEWIKNTNEDS